ncbi:MAG TPA: glycosyltransferase family 4 protein [Actinomycetota bacterium]|nr:glycosyltransferase family 4 protein [Actinomycetota bacterium]
MSARSVVHVLGPSTGGIRRHVRYLAHNPPPGFTTLRVCGPGSLEQYFDGLPFAPLTADGIADADVVHAHGVTAGRVALRRRRPPVVLTLHVYDVAGGRPAPARAALRMLAPAIVRRADAVIAVSVEIAARVPGAVVIPPAAEPRGAPRRDRREVRAELGAADDEVVVMSIARLHRDKSLHVLIEAARLAGLTCWVAGDGPLRAELERLAQGTRVRLLGYRDDVSDLLGAADLFALTSLGEGYPVVVVEALQAGLPVVATDVGAVREMVGDAGEIVDPGDATALASSLSRIAGNDEVRAGLMRRAGARSLPQPEELVRRVGEVYQRVMS